MQPSLEHLTPFLSLLTVQPRRERDYPYLPRFPQAPYKANLISPLCFQATIMSLPRYQPVDLKPKEDRVGENDYEQVDAPRKSRFTWKRLLVVLALAAIFQCTYLSVKHLSSSHPTTRPARLGTPCRGKNHKQSSAASLPTHYTLPSGDKIPSVALGASPCFLR